MNSADHKKGGAWRLFIWAGIIAAVSLVAVHFLLDWQANRQWQEALARLDKAGLSLDWRKAMPPSLPKSLNYAAIESLRGLYKKDDPDESTGKASASRQALLELRKGLERAYLPTYGVALGRPPDWSKVVKEIVETKFLEQSPSLDAAAMTILRALEEKRPLVRQISAQAFQYSDAEFLQGWREQDSSGPVQSIKTSYHTVLTDLCRLLFLHGMAAAEAGDPIPALADTRTLILLSKALLREPSVISHLLASAFLGQSCEILWSLCRHRGLPENHWADLQGLMTGINLEEHFMRSVNIHMVGSLETVEFLANHREQRPAYFQMPMVDAPLSLSRLSPVFPQWFFVLNKSALVEMEMNYVIRPFQENGWAGVLENQKALFARLGSSQVDWKHWDLSFAKLTIPPACSMVRQTLRFESQWRQAIVACALERFYLKHEHYPETLELLRPEFLIALPVDPMDQQPIRYRLTAAGRYQLWCVGLDGLDDGGKVHPGSGSHPGSSLRRPDYQGDWTWQYEPVPLPEGGK